MQIDHRFALDMLGTQLSQAPYLYLIPPVSRLQAPPAYAGETLYEGNKTYEAELGALIASRNAKMPELKDAPSVV